MSKLISVIISPQNRRISSSAQSAVPLCDLPSIRLLGRLIIILGYKKRKEKKKKPTEMDSVQPDSTCFHFVLTIPLVKLRRKILIARTRTANVNFSFSTVFLVSQTL